MRGQYKLFNAHHNLCGSWRIPSRSSGWILKSNKHTEIVGEVFCLKIERSLRISSNLSNKAWICLKLERERERESLSSRSFGSKYFQVNGVTKWVEGVETPFFRPHSESAHWGVRGPDISDNGAWTYSKNVTGTWSRHQTSPVHKTQHEGKMSGRTCLIPWPDMSGECL
jgi:hypothetical protein